MKSILIVIIIVIAAAVAVLLLGYGTVGERGIYEEFWQGIDGQGHSVDGSWGTEILVEYTDGSTENLNQPLPTMEVFFKDKQVYNFVYILHFRGSSDDYSSIEIDISNFSVECEVESVDGVWGVPLDYRTVVAVDVDEQWHEINRVTVSNYELESLTAGYTYNLTFTPSGSVRYRSRSTGSWTNVPLPSWFYLKFSVQNQITEDDDVENTEFDPDLVGEQDDYGSNSDNWIKVEVGSNAGSS